ncbi:MAG: WD40 repeat domain-containing serine/threonine protein kinase [Acidobacteriota bacterium]
MAPGPDTIGRYQILAELGRGGMGTVYRARDPVLERVVALKTVFSDMLAGPGMRERFLREARSAARLQHPNIVTIYEFGEVDGAPFIAMEFIEGEDLDDAARRGRLNETAAILETVAQLCDGLHFAHRHGVIHRDVKPSNVKLVGQGVVKILDFGVAWLEGATTTTRTGQLLGTPAYMAPEQFAGETIDHRVDQWAVGVILYELLGGRRPFQAPTVPSLIYHIVHSPLAPIDPGKRAVPESLAAILARALTKDREQRFADLAEMAAALRETRGELSTAAFGRTAPTRVIEAAVPPPPPLSPPPEVVAPVPVALTPPPPPSPPVSPPPVAEPPPAAEPEQTSPATSARVTRVAHTPSPLTPMAGRTPFLEDGAFGEPRRVQTAVLSPDEAYLVVGGTDGSIRFWDLGTRMRVAMFRNRVHLRTGHGSLTTCVAFSADGSLLVSGHLDGAVYLWEVASGLELNVKLGHEGAVGGAAITPGGEALVTGGADATIKFWEMPAVRAGDARRSLRRQPDAVTCLTLAGPGSTLVVTGHAGKTLRVHETATQRLAATLHGHRAPLNVLAVSPAGDLVASGARDGAVRVHHLGSREVRGVHEEHGRAVAGLAFFPDGRRIASVAMDPSVVIWNMDEPEEPITLQGAPDDAFAAVCVTADGKRVLAAAAEGHVKVWSAVR